MWSICLGGEGGGGGGSVNRKCLNVVTKLKGFYAGQKCSLALYFVSRRFSLTLVRQVRTQSILVVMVRNFAVYITNLKVK